MPDDIYKLYQTYEQEIRGENKPVEDVDKRPNYIGMCINMMETDQLKIKCLRRVREMTAMNPFYQHRIDRFVDAITNTWEPTEKPGFVEYIRGDKDSPLTESVNVNQYIDFLNDQGGPPSGPPPKEVQLKSSGAEQDDEEPPTDERTKKFEKDEAKVGVSEFDPLTLAATGGVALGKAGLAAAGALGKAAVAHPGITAGVAGLYAARKIHKNLKKDKRQACYDRYEGYPEKIKLCLQGGAP